jgi:hypothetical protein
MKNPNKNKKSSKTHNIVVSEENYISQREVAMNILPHSASRHPRRRIGTAREHHQVVER